MFAQLQLVLPAEAWDGAMQMAVDEVLLRTAEYPLLRIYLWQAPCVTFGYFQKIADVRRAYPNLPLVRRRTGGGMVEHGRDITFSLIIPKGERAAILSPTLFYTQLHLVLARVLEAVGKQSVLLAGEGDVVQGPACFQAPARDDLLFEGKKILGGAQCRSAGALLYQGSLQGMIQPSGCEEFARRFAKELASESLEVFLHEGIVRDARELLLSRYAASSWNERR